MTDNRNNSFSWFILCIKTILNLLSFAMSLKRFKYIYRRVKYVPRQWRAAMLQLNRRLCVHYTNVAI